MIDDAEKARLLIMLRPYMERPRAEGVCYNCERAFEPGEPVFKSDWRINNGGDFGKRMACEKCAALHAFRPPASWPHWPCKNCGRLVYMEKRHRKLRHVACSYRCRFAIDNQQAAYRRSYRRSFYSKTCKTCGKKFKPKRLDAKTCSPACRQKNYRLNRKLDIRNDPRERG